MKKYIPFLLGFIAAITPVVFILIHRAFMVGWGGGYGYCWAIGAFIMMIFFGVSAGLAYEAKGVSRTLAARARAKDKSDVK